MKDIRIKKSLNNKIQNNLLEKIEKSQLFEMNKNNILPNKNNIIIYLNKNEDETHQKNISSLNLFSKKYSEKKSIFTEKNIKNLREKLLNQKKIINNYQNNVPDNETLDSFNLKNKYNKYFLYTPVNDYNLKKNIILPNITNKLKNTIPRNERNSGNSLVLKGIHLDVYKLINNDPNLNNKKNIKMKEYHKHILKSKSSTLIRKIKTLDLNN